ncbi:Aldolase superfamily protein [Hibiscus syriacus]|uniref:Aldolase superfamily protein n=1 Tax=Hibiscus syriacus TaxID=106335 RepID=A0A6A3A0C2_HIBSY|nr:Aldolase superfamily protein [Hibiscus syriacus]
MMILRRRLACMSLLLLMLLQFRTPCSAALYDEFNRFKPGSGAGLSPKVGEFKGPNTGKDGDDIFGAEKRKVYAGPNPLQQISYYQESKSTKTLIFFVFSTFILLSL